MEGAGYDKIVVIGMTHIFNLFWLSQMPAKHPVGCAKGSCGY